MLRFTTGSPSTVGGLSSAPCSVTVWGLAQLSGVKVKFWGETRTSLLTAPLTAKTTVDSGRAVSTSVKVSEVPSSETLADVLLSVKPGVSLS